MSDRPPLHVEQKAAIVAEELGRNPPPGLQTCRLCQRPMAAICCYFPGKQPGDRWRMAFYAICREHAEDLDATLEAIEPGLDKELEEGESHDVDEALERIAKIRLAEKMDEENHDNPQ